MVNVGVIGLGYWGPNLLRNVYGNGRRGRIVICDSDPVRIGKISKRYPDLESTENCSDIFSDDDLDAVIIATDVSSHYSLAKMALESGKHVFVEKPFASSISQAEELVRLGREKKLVTMVGHTFMFSPPVIKVKEIIDSGTLGDIYFITSTRVNLGLHQKDVSVIWDLAPHDFSMLFYWLGQEPSEVSSFGNAFVLDGIPDVAFINLKFPGGTIGNVQVAWLAPSKLRRTVIVGSSKMLVYDDTEPIEKIKIYDKGVELIEPESFGEYQLTYRTGDILSPKISTDEPLASEMEEFLASIQEGRIPRSSGEEGLAVVRALQMAEASLEENGD
jgi:predicted dehydrogenase